LTQEAIDLENHKLRESWRRTLFNKFLSSSRRDAAAIGHPVYDEKRVQLAIHMFRDLGTHGRAVMMGQVISDARFDVMLRRPIQDCKWCNAGVTPSWEHLAWQCPAFQTSRCRALRDAIQFVLGWPFGQKQHDQAVIKHLADVRSKVLDRRYRPT